MATDRELLEAAAKAAGYTETRVDDRGWFYVCTYPGQPIEWELWNPLEDDADALRLAVKLGIAIIHDDAAAVRVGWLANQQCPITMDSTGPWFWKEWLRDNGSDPYAATRRAIVRAAAAMASAQRVNSK